MKRPSYRYKELTNKVLNLMLIDEMLRSIGIGYCTFSIKNDITGEENKYLDLDNETEIDKLLDRWVRYRYRYVNKMASIRYSIPEWVLKKIGSQKCKQLKYQHVKYIRYVANLLHSRMMKCCDCNELLFDDGYKADPTMSPWEFDILGHAIDQLTLRTAKFILDEYDKISEDENYV